MDDVVRCNVFLTDMANFTAMNAVYADNFVSPFSGSNDNQSCLLPLNAQIEIEMVVISFALIPHRSGGARRLIGSGSISKVGGREPTHNENVPP
jgi:hypothetical protein